MNRKSLYVWGGLIGLGLGIVAAYFYSRSADDKQAAPSAGDFVKLGMILIGLFRQLAEIGKEGSKAA